MLSSLAPQWSTAATRGAASMNAIAGGTVTVSDNAGNLIPYDAQGNPGAGISGLTSASPWSLGDSMWFGVTGGEASLLAATSSSLPSSPSPTSGGEPQQHNGPVPTASVTVSFTGNLVPGDYLSFLGTSPDVCGQTLWLRYCPNLSWLQYRKSSHSQRRCFEVDCPSALHRRWFGIHKRSWKHVDSIFHLPKLTQSDRG
jgi:hypothetical protein